MILAIDTSSAISVALVDGERAVAQRSEFSPRGHAELLASMVEEVLADAGIGGESVESIVVGTGPAPFTGLRVGLMTARALGLVWDVPVLGVCSLDAVGARAGHEGKSRVAVVADARRKEVYWATYADGVRDAGPQVSAPQDVAPHIEGQSFDVIGRGALLYPDIFVGAVAGDPDPAWLARVAAHRLAEGETDFPTEPLYLRRPDVHGVPGS